MGRTICRGQPIKNLLITPFKVCVLVVLGFIGTAQANNEPSRMENDTKVKQLIHQCMLYEEQRRNLPHGLLQAIAKVESNFNWNAYNRNKNGTYDIGLMQINSSHLPRLRTFGITERDLWNPCINVSVGAFILQENMVKHGINWVAVAAYNTGDPHKKPTVARRYAEKVYASYIQYYKSIKDKIKNGS